MTEENSPFPARLKAWRKRLKIPQDEASKALGVGRSYYNRLESGKKTPGRFLVEKFEILEREPVHSEHSIATPSARESEPTYEAIQHVIFIERSGTPEQIAAARAFLKTLREQVDTSDRSGDRS